MSLHEGRVEHGGTLAAFLRAWPDAPRPWLDLSTGINPVPYPVPPLSTDCLTRLPEPENVAALEAVAARAYGVTDVGRVVAAPGTELLIDLLPRLFPADAVRVVGPTYAEHFRAWRRSGAVIRDDARTVVLCNPNNPDGRRMTPDAVLALAHDRDLVVVDEAFADLEDGPLGVAATEHPATVVLRSFGKTYGLAGLRLGFAVTSRARAQIIRDALGPWAVSGPAIAAGLIALADAAWLDATRARLIAETARLDDLLGSAGLRVIGGTRLFRLAEADDAAGVFARLAASGIAVRQFREHPRWLRFGQPGEHVQRLADALSRD